MCIWLVGVELNAYCVRPHATMQYDTQSRGITMLAVNCERHTRFDFAATAIICSRLQRGKNVEQNNSLVIGTLY